MTYEDIFSGGRNDRSGGGGGGGRQGGGERRDRWGGGGGGGGGRDDRSGGGRFDRDRVRLIRISSVIMYRIEIYKSRIICFYKTSWRQSI